MAAINHRRFSRKKCLVPIEGKTRSLFSDVCMHDISQGGLGFISRKRIPLHKKIAIEVDFGAGLDPVLMLGEVKWVKSMKGQGQGQYRIGMKFVKVLVPGSRTRLMNYFGE